MDDQIKNVIGRIKMPEEKRQQTFDKIYEKCNKKRTYPIPKAAVAACVVIITIPTVAFAAEKLSSYLVQMKEDHMHTLFNISENESEAQETHVKLETTDLEGYTRQNILHMISFRSVENRNSQVLYVRILKTDGDTADFFEKNVTDSREIEINGRKAVYMEISGVAGSQYEENGTGKEIAVFYEDYGYVLLIEEHGNEEMEESEFLKLAEKFTLVPTQHQAESTITTVSEYMNEIENYIQNMPDDSEQIQFPEEKMCGIDGTLEYWGISYHIDNIEVRDNLRGLDAEKGNLNFKELLNNGVGVDENLNFMPYERETIGFGDGYESPERYVKETDTVTPKFVLVTITIKNISWEDENDLVQVGNPLSFIQKQGDDLAFDTREFERGDMEGYYLDYCPVWISDSEEGADSLLKKLPVGESVTLQLGYFVDEDMLDEMVMKFDFGGGLNDGSWSFIDMRDGK